LAGAGLLALISFGPVPARAGPDGTGPGARLSATLGGTLDFELGEAGNLTHPIDYSTITINPGRAVEYRRRVALEIRLAAQDFTAVTDTPRSAAPAAAPHRPP
jgi:hypothetical protein